MVRGGGRWPAGRGRGKGAGPGRLAALRRVPAGWGALPWCWRSGRCLETVTRSARLGRAATGLGAAGVRKTGPRAGFLVCPKGKGRVGWCGGVGILPRGKRKDEQQGMGRLRGGSSPLPTGAGGRARPEGGPGPRAGRARGRAGPGTRVGPVNQQTRGQEEGPARRPGSGRSETTQWDGDRAGAGFLVYPGVKR